MPETGPGPVPAGGPPESGAIHNPASGSGAPIRRLAECCLQLPGVQASGILLTDGRRLHRQFAAVGPAAGRLEQLQVDLAEGPCRDVCRTGTLLADVPLAHPHYRVRWPRFTSRALAEGFTATTAVPLQHHGRLLGALNLFHQHRDLEAAYIDTCQVLAETTAWALAREQELARVRAHNAQLQTALDSRVIIEQAKGVLTERLRLPPHEAFARLRAYARTHQRKLTAVAHRVVHGPADHGPFPRPRTLSPEPEGEGNA
ncbi:ANTAR domain-containing protein [Streptomyces chrestomyceticus]|uniref:ANTAR domain-containing protein n=1 Tax=Streptomyces chrestomyceticus TaxID=68185 RepID=UPI0036CCFB56